MSLKVISSTVFWHRLGCIGVATAVSSAAYGYHASGMPSTFLVWPHAMLQQLVNSLGIVLWALYNSHLREVGYAPLQLNRESQERQAKPLQAFIREYNVPAILLLLGMFMFCGTVYFYALTGLKPLGCLATPAGGITLMSAWFTIAIA